LEILSRLSSDVLFSWEFRESQNYNAAISPGFSWGAHGGADSLAGTHWVLENGTVITWEGDLIFDASSQ
jgi:hypothetical protein